MTIVIEQMNYNQTYITMLHSPRCHWRKSPKIHSPNASLMNLGSPPAQRKKLNKFNKARRQKLIKKYSPLRKILKSQLNSLDSLEKTLKESKETSSKLSSALFLKSYEMSSLGKNLLDEKQRNSRLINLLTSTSPVNSNFGDDTIDGLNYAKENMQNSLSPVLTQQRFDELELAYKHGQRRILEKEKLIEIVTSEKEELEMKYDQLVNEYCEEQRRFEIVCSQYMILQAKKKEQAFLMKNALSQACACIASAKKALVSPHDKENMYHVMKFDRNLDILLESLKDCGVDM